MLMQKIEKREKRFRRRRYIICKVLAVLIEGPTRIDHYQETAHPVAQATKSRSIRKRRKKAEMSDHHSAMSSPQIDDFVDAEQSEGSVRVVSGSGFRYVVPFPWRLHQMLEAIEKNGDSSIVSWLHDGQHFQVHNPQEFVDKVIPKFFKQKSYKSFQRQLHLYGFQRETEGPDRGAYFHESFTKKDRQLSLEISRIKAPKRRKTPASKVAVSKARTTTQVQTPSTTNALSALERFKPLDRKDLPRGPIRSIKPVISTPKPGFDPVMTFRQQQCSCHLRQNGYGSHTCLHTTAQVHRVSISPSTTSSPTISGTYNWLINAGVPSNAFDPTPVTSASQDLLDCAEEITSLFSDTSDKDSSLPAETCATPMTSQTSAGPPSFGFDHADGPLEIPQDIMLGDFNSAFWGL